MHLHPGAASSLQAPALFNLTVNNKGMSIITELVAGLLFPLFLPTFTPIFIFSHLSLPCFPNVGSMAQGAQLRLIKGDPSAQYG